MFSFFQKMSAPGGEAMQRSPGTPNGDVIEHSDDEKDRQEYLEVNFKYPLMLHTRETVTPADNPKKYIFPNFQQPPSPCHVV